MQKQHYSEALQSFRKALRLRPNYAAVYFQAGIARLKLHHLKMAKINFTKALKYNPNLKEAKLYLQQLAPEIPRHQVSQKKEASAKLLSSNHDSVQVCNFLQIQKSANSVLKSQKLENVETTNTISPKSSFLNRTKLYFQLFLFFSILFVIIGSVLHWIIRKNRMGNSRIEEKDFQTSLQDYLQKLQEANQQQNSGSVPVQGNDSIYEVGEKIDKEPTFPSSDFNTAYFKRFTATSVRPYVGDDLQQKIESYVGLGFSIEEIAQRLRIGKGEVQLRLGLKGKRTHMKAPELRFEFDY